MKRNLEKIANSNYDLIIIGGGIFGACAAWEAASRGLSVVLLEKGDFCQATSANHYKMVHGGIRYIQHGDIYRIRESSRERKIFLKIAPHLVNPLPILIPTYGHGLKGKQFLGIGIFIYDMLTLDRNWGIKDPNRKTPFLKFLSKKEVLDLYPFLDSPNLTGGALFYDGQIYNSHRLGLSFIHSAVNIGADVANYLKAEEILIKHNKVIGLKVRDMLGGNTFDVQGKVVINAAGPWAADLFYKSVGEKLNPQPSFSRDTAIILNRKPQNSLALAVTTQTKDIDALIDRGGRHLFMVPWRNYTMFGVWHVVYDKKPDHVIVTDEEIEEIISEINQANPAFNISYDDISLILSGLTLFGERKPGSKRLKFGKRSLLIDHLKINNIQGLLTLVGVRATVAREMAQKIINLVGKRSDKKIRESETHKTPIWGGDIVNIKDFENFIFQNYKHITNNILYRLIRNYGSKITKILDFDSSINFNHEQINGTNLLKSEIVYAIRHEMALKLSDVVLRRTDIGSGGNPGDKVLYSIMSIMKKELQWSEEQAQKEMKDIQGFYKTKGAIKLYDKIEQLESTFNLVGN